LRIKTRKRKDKVVTVSVYEDQRFKIERDRLGFYTLYDKANLQSVYLQGESADVFREELRDWHDWHALCDNYTLAMQPLAA